MPSEFWKELIEFVTRWRAKCPEQFQYLLDVVGYAEDKDIANRVRAQQIKANNEYFEKLRGENE